MNCLFRYCYLNERKLKGCLLKNPLLKKFKHDHKMEEERYCSTIRSIIKDSSIKNMYFALIRDKSGILSFIHALNEILIFSDTLFF